MCLAHYKRLLLSWGYLYFAGRKVGWGFYSLILTNVRLAEKKAPPPGAFYEKPLYSFLLYVHKVQVIPDLTRNDPDDQKKKEKKKMNRTHFIKN